MKENDMLEALLDEMRATNASIVAFDGAGFAMHVQNEIELASRLSANPDGYSAGPLAVENLRRLASVRKCLLRRTQRTVAALLGIVQTTQETYELSLLPHG